MWHRLFLTLWWDALNSAVISAVRWVRRLPAWNGCRQTCCSSVHFVPQAVLLFRARWTPQFLRLKVEAANSLTLKMWISAWDKVFPSLKCLKLHWWFRFLINLTWFSFTSFSFLSIELSILQLIGQKRLFISCGEHSNSRLNIKQIIFMAM